MDLIYILSAIYFYLPGAVANMGASVAKFVPWFRMMNTPVDGGLSWKGHRLIGEHKIWGGFIGGLIIGFSFGLVKIFLLDKYWPGYLFFNLDPMREILLVFLLSFGALSGDILKSIAKRLLSIPPHNAWIPFDEIDHTLISMLLVKIFFGIEWRLIFLIVGIFFVFHLVTNMIAYRLKIKKVPY